MTMVKVTYDDGESTTVVTWTPEYGVMMAGPNEQIAKFDVEVIEPEPVAIPLHSGGQPVLSVVPGPAEQQAATEADRAAAARPIEPINTQACVACSHTDKHLTPDEAGDEAGCTAPGCGCYTAVYP